MPNSLGADQLVSKLLNIAGLTAQEHYFQARIVIQMGMERRNNYFVMFMLKISELFGKKPSVMVIDQSDGSDYGGFRCHNRGFNKLVANQVSKGLGSVLVAFFSDELVKTIEKI